MRFSDEDKILITNLHNSKGNWAYGAKKLMKEFPGKGWRKVDCHLSTRDKSIVWTN